MFVNMTKFERKYRLVVMTGHLQNIDYLKDARETCALYVCNSAYKRVKYVEKMTGRKTQRFFRIRL
jgi:hypothetical protein